LDDTDLKTPEVSLTINNTDIKLSKNGAAAVDKNSGGGTHIVNGNYAITLDATDTDTQGELHISVLVSGAVVVVAKFTVLTASVYDDLYGASAAAFDDLSTEIAAVQSDTDNIQSRLPAILTSGTADSGSNTTMVDSARSEADTDYWKGSWIRFTSGDIGDQTRLVTGFNPATDTITFFPATTQAVSTQNYELLPAANVDLSSVWDEDIEAAHGTDATAGLLLRSLGQNISNETHDANLLDQLRKLTSVVEHLRGSHTHQPIGKIFYVDPVNGDTHANGNRGGISDPYSLVQDCHDNAVTDSNHDVIILLAGAAAGLTTLTETVTLSKRYLFVRGPGRDFLWTRSGNGDTITVTADGVELSGFQLNTAATGFGNGITVTSAGFFKAYRLWVNDTQGDAIEMTDCDNWIIENCRLQGSGVSGAGHGIEVLAGSGETGDFGAMRGNYILNVQGDGIRFDTSGGGTVSRPVVYNNVIEGCTDDGIDIIDSGVSNAIIVDNRFGNNTSDDIEDAGTATVLINNEQFAKNSDVGVAGASLSAIPWNAAWDTEVESEVNDAIDTAISELGVGAPTATPTIRTALMLMYMAMRNKLVVQTSGTDALEVYNDAGTKIASKLLTDDGSDYTEAKAS
jgi:hypothetical protein